MLKARGEIKSLRTPDGKDGGGTGQGTGTAVVAVFGNVDSYGDRIIPGAFAKDLAERQTYPFIWTHSWRDVPVGVITAARETDEGLEVDFKLFIGEHPDAEAVYAAMRDGAIKEFSIGYRVRDARWVTETIDDLQVEIRELLDLELIEAGPTLMGANSETHLVGLKAADRTVDRDELLAKAVALAEDLAQLDAAAGDQLRAAALELKTSTASSGRPSPAPSGLPTSEDLDALEAVLAHIPLPA